MSLTVSYDGAFRKIDRKVVSLVFIDLERD